MVSALSDFHLLRPWWLLALLPAAFLLWRMLRAADARSAWARACDAELLPFLLGDAAARRRWPRVLLPLATLAALLALAGPSWQRVPQPLVSVHEAHVIALDLSASMHANDLQPSRLAQARHALAQWLDAAPPGRFALVAFAGSAFAVVPLTDDRRTVSHLLKVLTPDLMPWPGGDLAAAIDEARALLEGGHAARGELMLVTDSKPRAAALDAARRLAQAGHRLRVIGVGSAAGSTIPVAGEDGRLLLDQDGVPVQARLDEAGLRALASAGGGRYERLDGAQLAADTSSSPRRIALGEADTRLVTDLWRDEGAWLVLLLVPLAALGFRRGWLALLCLALPLWPPQPGYAGEGDESAWRNADQRAHRLLQDGRLREAARLFEDPRWRGVAEYRAGYFVGAADAFAEGESADDHYNRGNALARAGRYTQALEAYDRALELSPQMEDALFNRALVERLLAARNEPEVLSAGSQPLDDAEGASGDRRRAAEGSGSEERSPRQGRGSDAGRAQSRQSEGLAGSERVPAPSADPEDAEGDGDAPAPDRGEDAAGSESAQDSPRARSEEAPPSSAPHGAQRADEAEQGASPDRAAGTGAQGPGQASPELPDEAYARDAQAWLREVPDDPGGLLRRKFARLQQRRGVAPEVEQPW